MHQCSKAAVLYPVSVVAHNGFELILSPLSESWKRDEKVPAFGTAARRCKARHAMRRLAQPGRALEDLNLEE